ncbi:hypothetical protein XENOCAPTIV_017985, partial [Xenoophorus captivus]
KIKPEDLVGLTFPHYAVRLVVTTGGENGDLNHRNGPWYNAVEHLCTDLITKFPQRSDCAVLQQVKQHPDETVADFLYRMEEAFNKHSGMERPADFTILGPWEKMLCGYIMEGLLPEIAAQTKTLYVGWRHGVRFEELKRHALHSDDVINDRKKKKVDKRETDFHNAALTLYCSTNQHGSFPRGRGRGRRAEVGEGDNGAAPMLAIIVESWDTGGMNVQRNCSGLTAVTNGGRTGPWIWLPLALRRGLLRSVRFHKHTHSCIMILIHIGCLQRP